MTDALDPLRFHGIQFPDADGKQNELTTDCPFCGKDDHLYGNSGTGQWTCHRCSTSGNASSFFSIWTEYCQEQLTSTRLEWLAKNRGIPGEAFEAYEVGWNPLTSSFVLPVRGYKGNIIDLRSMYTRNGKIQRAYTTKGAKTGLLNAHLLKDHPTGPLYIAEGEWDAIAMSWTLRTAKAKGLVLGVPGASIFRKDWVDSFQGRDVILLYDNDEAGAKGAERAKKLLTGTAHRLRRLAWPKDFSSGYDVRDLVVQRGPRKAYRTLRDWLLDASDRPQPASPRSTAGSVSRKVFSQKKRAPTYEEVREEYGRYLEFSPDMDIALKLIFGVSATANMRGEPLWLYLVAPPGGSKTVMLSGLKQSEACVWRSTLSPHMLISGQNTKSGDPSLLPLLNRKCLVLKDATELLAMHESDREEIFGTLRGAYDGTVEKSYGNAVRRHYEDLKFNVLAGITPVIYGHQGGQANLGERFLKFRMSRTRQEENDLVRRAAETFDQETEVADSLADISQRFLSHISARATEVAPTPPDFLDRIVPLAQVVARLRSGVEWDYRGGERIMRSRPETEIGSRLAKQLVKFGHALSLVRGGGPPGDEEYEIARRLAQDSSHGFNLDIIRVMMDLGGEKLTFNDIQPETGIPSSTFRLRLEDLEILNLVVRTGTVSQGVGRPRYLYSVEPSFRKMWRNIH